MNKEFWRGKRVSICGGGSFIASHVIEELLRLDVARIDIMDDWSSGKSENIHYVNHITFVHSGDLRDYKWAKYATAKVDIVLDLASVHGGRGFVGTNHDVAISDNLIINTNVLRAAVENHVERIAFASSGCVYDTFDQMDENYDFKIVEDDYISPDAWEISNPDGMYGLTKAVHEKVLGAYHRDGLIKTAICRFFTVFGPRMKENHFVLASIAKSFIKTDPYFVWGENGNEVRNFTPVQNTVEGFLLATEKANGEAYNIGL